MVRKVYSGEHLVFVFRAVSDMGVNEIGAVAEIYMKVQGNV